MLNQSNNRNKGRFIKKDDPVRRVLTISDFNLMEICDKPVAYHDNANANIIHNKLHDEDELAESVRDSYEINLNFPHESRPVIRPLNFTAEWKKQRKRQANRNQKIEDEEEFELDVTSLLVAKKIDFRKATFKIMETALGHAGSMPVKNPNPPIFQHAATDDDDAFESDLPLDDEPWTEVPLTVETKPESKMRAKTELPPSVDDDFVPYVPTRSVSNPEMAASRMEQAALSEEEKEGLRKAAEAEGYQMGFQQGEEKGTLSAQANVQSLTEQLSSMMENIQGMQKSILAHVQDNFLTICQSFLEALLQREFRINPESFGKVIERAIADALPEDEFFIHMSPQAFKSLSNWASPELRRRIRVDDKLQDYHFRVDAKHAVVDGNISKIIQDLLNQADIQLFDSEEKAS